MVGAGDGDASGAGIGFARGACGFAGAKRVVACAWPRTAWPAWRAKTGVDSTTQATASTATKKRRMTASLLCSAPPLSHGGVQGERTSPRHTNCHAKSTARPPRCPPRRKSRQRVALWHPATNADAEARLFVLLRNECLSRRADAGDLNDYLAILGPRVMGSLRWLGVEGAGGIGFELALIPLVAGGEIERS